MEMKKVTRDKRNEFTITTYDNLGFLKMNTKRTLAEYSAAETKFKYHGASGISCEICMMYVEKDKERSSPGGRILVVKILQGPKVSSIEYWKLVSAKK